MKELVIKLSERTYIATCNEVMLPPDVKNVVNAIKNGTPLPKGHGRLIDADKLLEEYGKYDIGFAVDRQPTIIEAETSLDDIFNRGYQQGLNDAWECARKIDSDRDIENYVFGKDLEKDYDDVSASEAIEKIKEYEEKKNQTFRIGDEVYVSGSKQNAIITALNHYGNGELANIIFSNGNIACRDTSAFCKTGRHFQQIKDILKEMEEV